MTRIAMARNWRLATPEQQKELTAEFKTLLVRTYSTALSNYRDQLIDYKPLRAKPEDVEVTVRSEVKHRGSSQPVAIDYEMEKTPDGWKVYDVKVGGVSLVTTYRDTFASEVKERGVDGLIKSLAAKNRQSERERAKSISATSPKSIRPRSPLPSSGCARHPKAEPDCASPTFLPRCRTSPSSTESPSCFSRRRADLSRSWSSSDSRRASPWRCCGSGTN